MESLNAQFPTGVEDVDREVLIRLDPKSLNSICISNKEINRLCTPFLWKLKFIRDYVNLGNNVDYKKIYNDIYNISINNLLLYSVVHGYNNLILYALEHGADIHTEQDLALINAAKYGHVSTVNLLFDRGANIDSDNEALIFASEKGYLEIVTILLNKGANKYNMDLALFAASAMGRYDVVKILLDYGANVHARQNSALDLASNYRHFDVVRLLRQYMNAGH